MVLGLTKSGTELTATLLATATQPTDLTQALHMMLGVCGEVGEVVELLEGFKTDSKKLTLELGDLLFYLRGVEQYLEPHEMTTMDSISVMPDPQQNPGRVLYQTSGALAEMLKKHWAYNRELDVPAFAAYLRRMYSAIKTVCERDQQGTMDEIFRANYEKLSTRYPDLEYSDRAANERVDQQPEKKNKR